MLNGIPEVDLGINNKLKNIERTETAKRLMGSCSKKIIRYTKTLYTYLCPVGQFAEKRAILRPVGQFFSSSYV